MTYSTCVNFGFTSSAIQSCGDNDVVMYCWPEIVGKRGSDEVISCLHDYLSKLPPGVMTLRLYSDGCGGRNKNINVLRYLFTLVAVGKFKHIRHTFPVWGHSFLPTDRDFGRTELAKHKHERVYTTQQWMDITEKARPFKTISPDQSMFLEYANHFTMSRKLLWAKCTLLDLTCSSILLLNWFRSCNSRP